MTGCNNGVRTKSVGEQLRLGDEVAHERRGECSGARCRVLPPPPTYRYRVRAIVAAILILANGCGSRCHEVQRARTALAHAGAPDRTADVRVSVPLDRANELIAELLRAEPLEAPIDVPDLGPIEVMTTLRARLRDVRVQPGGPDKLRFAIRLEIRDDERTLTTLGLVTEVAPQLERDSDGAMLAIGFGPENLLSVKPELGRDASRALTDAVTRALPGPIRDRVPRVIIETAVNKLTTHLTDGAYRALQATLLKRVGEVTRVKLRLPDVPITKWTSHSTESVLTVELVTDLPVRHGLVTAATEPTEITVAIAGSAVAELANWAIDKGHAPRWYNRVIQPKTDGDFRPQFDYIVGARNPFKVYSFQERNGCSYFRIGVRASIAMKGEQLEATALDRDLEHSAANPVVEVAGWVKYFLVGALDRSKRVATHTRLAIGSRILETRVVDAAIQNDEVRFALKFAAK